MLGNSKESEICPKAPFTSGDSLLNAQKDWIQLKVDTSMLDVCPYFRELSGDDRRDDAFQRMKGLPKTIFENWDKTQEF